MENYMNWTFSIQRQFKKLVQMEDETVFDTNVHASSSGSNETGILSLTGGEKTALVAVLSIMALIITLGSLGNILAIVAVIQTKKLQTVSNLFVANLSICDLMFVTIVLPVNMYTYISEGWIFDMGICKFIGFLGYTLTGTTILTITLIAWNRYKLVVDVGNYKGTFRPRNMALMLTASWIIPVLCLQPAVFGKWGQFGFVPMLSTCNLGLDNSSQTFKIFLLIVRAAIPCGLIIYYYLAIYATTRASHRRLRHISSTASNTMQQNNQRREMRLTRMMIGIFVVFAVSYFPCTISSVIDWSRLLSKSFHLFCQTSVFLGSAINPLLYGFMNDQFRTAYYQIITCSCVFRRANEYTVASKDEGETTCKKSPILIAKNKITESGNRDKFYLLIDQSISSSPEASPRMEKRSDPNLTPGSAFSTLSDLSSNEGQKYFTNDKQTQSWYKFLPFHNKQFSNSII